MPSRCHTRSSCALLVRKPAMPSSIDVSVFSVATEGISDPRVRNFSRSAAVFGVNATLLTGAGWQGYDGLALAYARAAEARRRRGWRSCSTRRPSSGDAGANRGVRRAAAARRRSSSGSRRPPAGRCTPVPDDRAAAVAPGIAGCEHQRRLRGGRGGERGGCGGGVVARVLRRQARCQPHERPARHRAVLSAHLRPSPIPSSGWWRTSSTAACAATTARCTTTSNGPTTTRSPRPTPARAAGLVSRRRCATATGRRAVFRPRPAPTRSTMFRAAADHGAGRDRPGDGARRRPVRRRARGEPDTRAAARRGREVMLGIAI